MLSIIQLLADPNPSDPINLEAARMLQQDPESYDTVVRLMIEQEGGDGEAGREGQQGANDLDVDVAEGDEADEGANNVDP